MGKTVVGIGEALFDVLPEGKKLGGAPANFAYHVSQFGIDSMAVSAVGNDELGREIIRQLDDHHLQHIIETVAFPTGTVQVELDEKGVPQYEIKENVAWDNIPYTDKLDRLAKDCSAVCFGSLAQRSKTSRDTIRRFLDNMPDDANCYKIFDINLRQHFFTRDIITDSMSHCNILKINDEELETITSLLGIPDGNTESKCRYLLKEYKLKMLILTCGVSGSYVFSASETSFIDTPKVEVADTVGAGDSFTGAFVASLLKGKTIRDAHEAAVKVSAYVCTQNGAMPLLPKELTSL